MLNKLNLPVSQCVPVNLGVHEQVYDDVYVAPFWQGFVPSKRQTQICFYQTTTPMEY